MYIILVRIATLWQSVMFAGMAELADAHGSGPCEVTLMRVQVPFPALKSIEKSVLFLFREEWKLRPETWVLILKCFVDKIYVVK